jgi:hypothetical protein
MQCFCVVYACKVHDWLAGLCSSLLFNGEHNILGFLKKTIPMQDKAFVKTKEALLIFIAEYIKVTGRNRIQHYALNIKVLTAEHE